MKFFIVALALIAVVAAQKAAPVPVAILRQFQDISPDGTFSYGYETDNGIKVNADGSPAAQGGEEGPPIEIRGSYSFVGEDGVTYTVTYTADADGFHPEGDHLPVAPAGAPSPPARAQPNRRF